jgi:uncharacterized protein DUF4350
MTPQTVNRLTAGVATGSFLALSILLAALAGHQSSDTLLKRPSTFFTDPSGARALFLVTKEFLPAAEQWRRPLTTLPLARTPEDANTLFIAGPGQPLAESEAEHLHRWLSAGGQLVLLTANGWPLRQRTAAGETTAEPYNDEEPRAKTFLSRYVPGLRWTKQGQLNTGRAAGSSIPAEEITLGWRRSFARTDGAKVVASAGNVPLAVELPVGHGRIVAIADPTMASNGALRRSDNAVWLIGLAAGWGGKLLFDEYHHGFGQKRGTLELTRAFFVTPWGWCLLQIIVAGLFYVFFYRRRFGRIKETPSPNRSSPLELVEARAGFLRVARAQSLAADLIVQHLCQIAGKAHRKTVDTADLDRELEILSQNRGTKAPVTVLREIFAKIRRGKRLSDEEFVELGRTAGEIVKGQKL